MITIIILKMGEFPVTKKLVEKQQPHQQHLQKQKPSILEMRGEVSSCLTDSIKGDAEEEMKIISLARLLKLPISSSLIKSLSLVATWCPVPCSATSI